MAPQLHTITCSTVPSDVGILGDYSVAKAEAIPEKTCFVVEEDLFHEPFYESSDIKPVCVRTSAVPDSNWCLIQDTARLVHNLEELTEDDIIIALMGRTGTGKSTFINSAIGEEIAPVSHSVKSTTTEVQLYGCVHPDKPDKRIFFLDTPGFDNTGVAICEKDVLESIAEWLVRTYKRKIKLTGILLLWSVTSARITGTDLCNLHIFTDLCGPDALRNVIVLSTGWEELEALQIGEMREEKFKEILSADIAFQDIRYSRFSDRTRRDAFGIIDLFLNRAQTLQIQREVVDQRKPLALTLAFQAVRKTCSRWWSSNTVKHSGFCG